MCPIRNRYPPHRRRRQGSAWLRERIGDDLLDAVVINTRPEAYRREDGIAIIPAVLLGPR